MTPRICIVGCADTAGPAAMSTFEAGPAAAQGRQRSTWRIVR